ncbi:MAG TPA: p-hydroxycinnamoyl CoA hydratase/lyase [Chloroflexota bacterium]|nr:p-hydroxycinnamoyl CoA hydratase/lyase [Chloroflexota bacterium]
MAGEIGEFQHIRIEREDGLTWLILNRPEKRNATHPPLHFEMQRALTALETDPDTGVLVLTGAGDSFCAGQDLKEYFRALDADPVGRARARKASHDWTWERLWLFPRPTIAMVNGYCFGNAFTPLVACDFAIAAEDAIFGLSEINWGIFPGGLVSRVVADVLSYRDALYYILTGRPFDGRKAAELRLVTYAVPRAELRAETVKLARELLGKNPYALRAAKEAYKLCRLMDYAQAYNYLTAKSAELRGADPEHGREQGIRQFIDEKRYRPGFESYQRGG